MKIIRNILHTILFVIIIFVISTYGWGFFNRATLVQTLATEQMSQRLKGHVYKLSHEIGGRSISQGDNLEKAANYIDEQFKAYGYDTEIQTYEVSGRKVENVIALKKGLKNPSEVIVVGAHYDSHDNPGADDNASGVAGLLELARLFANKETNKSIKFAAFVNEETPYFKTNMMGSNVFAKEAKLKGEDIKAAVILEMIGYYSSELNSQRYPPILGFFYPNRGNFILMAGNSESHLLTKRSYGAFKQATTFPVRKTELGFVPGIDFSDHWSFWQQGYNAIMVTDSAFYRNVNYHKATDTYEKLDYISMEEVVKGLSSVVSELAK